MKPQITISLSPLAQTSYVHYAPNMELLTGIDIGLRYHRFEVFNKLNFAVLVGKRIGLVGRNGSGKTSLIKILAGLTEPDEGEIIKSKQLKIAYLPQDFIIPPNKTIQDILFNQPKFSLEEYAEHEERIRNLLPHFDIPNMQRLMAELSGGQQRQIFLLQTLAYNADITLLDEPTNHLDLQRLDALQELFASWEKTLITISHDRFFLDQIATDIWELDRGKLYTYEGNYRSFLDKQNQRYEIEEKQHLKLEQEINRELEWVRSGVKARGTKDTGRMQRFIQMETEYNSYRPKPPELKLPLPKPQPLGNKILILENLNVIHPENSITNINTQKPLIQDLNLNFHKNMRLGILGPNGSGKTTLIRTILGLEKQLSGIIRCGQNTIFNYQDQKRLRLPEHETIKQIISENNNELQFGERKINVYAYLSKFLFSSSDLDKTIDSLSGGQRARVLLARILKEGGNFLILDEPTNDLDLDTTQALENALIAFNGCIILVSHDRFFLDQVCTHLLVLEGEGRWQLIDGAYSSYVKKYGGLALFDTEIQNSNLPEVINNYEHHKVNKSAKVERQQKVRIRELEKEMELIQTQIQDLEIEFQNPEFYITNNTPKLIAKKMDKITLKKEQLNKIEHEWVEIMEQLE